MNQVVIETPSGWMIKCPSCQWHEFPKKGKPGASWTFNGDLFKPTFTPSMNQLMRFSEAVCEEDRRPDRRCHFIITAGRMQFCGDCTHDYKNKIIDMVPWPDVEVRCYQATMEDHRMKSAPVGVESITPQTSNLSQ